MTARHVKKKNNIIVHNEYKYFFLKLIFFTKNINKTPVFKLSASSIDSCET